MRPDDSRGIDCYPDADFAGLYGQEDSQDPHCTRSRTEYVIPSFLLLDALFSGALSFRRR
eukprot:scaffold16518_cov36-Cyclotella_meneghiniana.AAC.3